MKKIYKYTLEVSDMQRLVLPVGAEILTVQMVGGFICLYARCDPDALTEGRLFAMYGTGHSMTFHNHKYIGTVQLHGGQIVFHVFEIID